MIDQEFEPGLYAIIPAAVLYSPDLRPNAKLVYGVISALARKSGYCWAANATIGEPLGLAKRTMEDIIRQLRDSGYIAVEVEVDPETHEVVRRKLWITGAPGLEHPPTTEIRGTSHVKQWDPATDFGVSYKVDSNTSNIPPKPPKGGDGVKHTRGYQEHAAWKPERFEAFWTWYRTHVRPENRQAAIRAWDKLQPDDGLIRRIGHALEIQIRSESWQAGIGKPHAATYLNNHRWEEAEDLPSPHSTGGQPDDRKWGWA